MSYVMFIRFKNYDFITKGQVLVIIYNLTNVCTIISNTTITNNMLLYVSTFKMSSSGSSLCLAEITYRYVGLGKIKLLKYKMIKFNKMLLVQRDYVFRHLKCHPQEAHCALLKLHTDMLVLVK